MRLPGGRGVRAAAGFMGSCCGTCVFLVAGVRDALGYPSDFRVAKAVVRIKTPASREKAVPSLHHGGCSCDNSVGDT